MSVTDELTGLIGWGQRSATVRFELLDKSNSYIGVLDVERSSPPTVDNNINRTIKRQMRGLKLPPSVTAEVDTLAERVRPVWVMQDGTEKRLGVFLFADATRSRAMYGSAQLTSTRSQVETDATMTDQLADLDFATGGVTIYAPGTLIKDALEEQMQVAGVLSHEIDDSAARVIGSAWMVWHPDKTRLQVINDLCQAGGYYTLWFDNEGVAQMRLVPDLQTVNPDFDYGPGGIVRAGSIAESDDLLSAPNRYLVINNSLTDGAVWGLWDVPDEAPHSFANTGRRKVKVVNSQAPETMEDAEAAAKAYGQADYSTYRWVSLDTAPNPDHDTFDIVTWIDGRYREQSWRLPLVEGADMHHEWRRVFFESVAGVFQ